MLKWQPDFDGAANEYQKAGTIRFNKLEKTHAYNSYLHSNMLQNR